MHHSPLIPKRRKPLKPLLLKHLDPATRNLPKHRCVNLIPRLRHEVRLARSRAEIVGCDGLAEAEGCGRRAGAGGLFAEDDHVCEVGVDRGCWGGFAEDAAVLGIVSGVIVVGVEDGEDCADY